RRDHAFALGNGRVNAIATNDGYVEVTIQDRGITYLDKLDVDQKNFAGGYGFVDDGEASWCTAYKWRPKGSKTTRTFGMGYAESTMEHRGVFVQRRTFAPAGDGPLVIDEVTLENRSGAAKKLS